MQEIRLINVIARLQKKDRKQLLNIYIVAVANLARREQVPPCGRYFKIQVREEILERTGRNHRALVYRLEYLTNYLARATPPEQKHALIKEKHVLQGAILCLMK